VVSKVHQRRILLERRNNSQKVLIGFLQTSRAKTEQETSERCIHSDQAVGNPNFPQLGAVVGSGGSDYCGGWRERTSSILSLCYYWWCSNDLQRVRRSQLFFVPVSRYFSVCE
jgi:hypothetical protein